MQAQNSLIKNQTSS